MGFNARIVFRGLCTFVPGSDIVKPMDWMGVLLVNTDEKASTTFGVKLPRHYPILRFKASYLRGLTSAPEKSILLHLFKQDLVIISGSKMPTPKLTANLGRKGRKKPGKNAPEQEFFFDWTPKLNEVLPSAGDVNEDCLQPNPGSGSNRVIARIHLTQGQLRTRKLSTYDGNFIVSQFDPPPPGKNPVEHAVPKTVELRIDDIPGDLKLRMRGYGESKSKESELVFSHREGEIVIEVLNVCLDDLIEEGAATPRVYPGPDPDFGWYYILSADLSQSGENGTMTIDPELPIPVAKEFLISKGPGGRDPAICTKTQSSVPSKASVQLMLEHAMDIMKGNL